MTDQPLNQNQPQPEQPQPVQAQPEQPQPAQPQPVQTQAVPPQPVQTQAAQPQAAQPQQVASKADKAGTVAFVCGLCSFTGILIALAGWVLGIIAIVFGVRGRQGANSSKATIGLVCGIIGLVIAAINSVAGAVLMTQM